MPSTLWHADVVPPYTHLDPGPFAFARGGDVGALLLHGFTGSPTEVRGLGEHLAGQGISVTAPLLPGHGLHHRDLEHSTRHEWLDAARGALADVRRRHRHTVVVGQSMGGLLALMLAAEATSADGTDIAAVVALAPALLLPRYAQLTRLPLPMRFMAKHEERTVDLVDKSQVRQVWSYSHTPMRVVRELLRLGTDVKGALHRIQAPLLVVQGAQDKTIRTASAQHVLDGVGSARKELLWLEGTGHIVPVDAERALVWQRVTSFIDQTTSPSVSGSQPS